MQLLIKMQFTTSIQFPLRIMVGRAIEQQKTNGSFTQSNQSESTIMVAEITYCGFETTTPQSSSTDSPVTRMKIFRVSWMKACQFRCHQPPHQYRWLVAQWCVLSSCCFLFGAHVRILGAWEENIYSGGNRKFAGCQQRSISLSTESMKIVHFPKDWRIT